MEAKLSWTLCTNGMVKLFIQTYCVWGANIVFSPSFVKLIPNRKIASDKFLFC